MGRKPMHTTAETVDEKFGLFDNTYYLVVPAGGLRDGYDVVVAFNGKKKDTFDDRENAIQAAQEWAEWQGMDGVIAFHPPEERDEE